MVDAEDFHLDTMPTYLKDNKDNKDKLINLDLPFDRYEI